MRCQHKIPNLTCPECLALVPERQPEPKEIQK